VPTKQFQLKQVLNLEDPSKEKVMRYKNVYQRLVGNQPLHYHVMIPGMTNLDIGQNPPKIAAVGAGTAKMGTRRSIAVNATYASA
jgi:hypothetical protein